MLEQLADVETSRLQKVTDMGGAAALVQSYIDGETAGLYVQQLLLGLDANRGDLLRTQFEIDALRAGVIEILSSPVVAQVRMARLIQPVRHLALKH